MPLGVVALLVGIPVESSMVAGTDAGAAPTSHEEVDFKDITIEEAFKILEVRLQKPGSVPSVLPFRPVASPSCVRDTAPRHPEPRPWPACKETGRTRLNGAVT